MRPAQRLSASSQSRQERQSGFTLVEAIMVIVITGIIAAAVAIFIRSPVDGYLDAVSRSELTDAADTALRRIARDVRTALPNSLRTTSPPSSACFEFIPSVGGGRYRIAPGNGPVGDILDFTAADSSFDVIASSNLPPAGGYGTAYNAVVYNLGIPGADAYTVADHNRAKIALSSNATAITLDSANLFPFESPGHRFDVVPDYAIVYACAGTAVRRSTRALAQAQMGSCPNATVGEVLVANVDCANSFFAYEEAVTQRNGLLSINLVLTGSRGGERVTLYQEVQVDNTP